MLLIGHIYTYERSQQNKRDITVKIINIDSRTKLVTVKPVIPQIEELPLCYKQYITIEPIVLDHTDACKLLTKE